MTPILHLLLALGSVALAEINELGGVDLTLAVPGLISLPYAIAVWTHGQSLRGRRRAAEWGRRLLVHSAPLLQIAAVGVFGWHERVLGWAGVQSVLLGWPHPAILVSLLPYAAYELASIDARGRVEESEHGARKRLRRFRTRMFVASSAPLVVYIGLCWLAGTSAELRAFVEHVALFNALFVLALLALFALFLPLVLRSAWEVRPLAPGPGRSVLEALAQRAGFRYRELYEWRTGNMMANAAILGIAPRLRYVLFSDALLLRLDLRELVAVLAHEMGHAQRRHPQLIVLWVIGFFLGVDLLLGHVVPVDSDWQPVLFALLLVAWLFAFGYVMRRFELDADLYALELTGDPVPLMTALERVGGRHARRKNSWRHFCTAERVLFLRAAARDPGVGRRLRATLRRWVLVGAALGVAALGAQFWFLAERWPEDRLLVDLVRGRYLAAAERQHDAELELDDELACLVERGRALAQELNRSSRVSEPELERATRAAFDTGAPEVALELTGLLFLRGHHELSPLLEACEGVLEGSQSPTAAELDGLPEDWRPLFERWRARADQHGA